MSGQGNGRLLKEKTRIIISTVHIYGQTRKNLTPLREAKLCHRTRLTVLNVPNCTETET